MHGRLPDVAKEGQKGLLMLAELARHAAMGEMGNLYTKWYLEKGPYRETPESGIQWVIRCMTTPRYFYKMFRMSCDNPPRKIPYHRLKPIHFGH
jgi:hypothetical protein